VGHPTDLRDLQGRRAQAYRRDVGPGADHGQPTAGPHSQGRTKSARQHAIPLPRLAVDLLRSLPDAGAYIFTVRAGKPAAGFARAKARADALSGVTGWRLHDLRRTVATGLARMGTPPHVVSEILGHAPAGITRQVYDRYSYEREVREALERWAARLQSITTGPGVASF
jgi:integrase